MKKVLQNFFGKFTILVCMLCAFAFGSYGQGQHITMSTANCTVSGNEVQVDIMVTNDGTQDLRWNGAVVRVTWPLGMFATNVPIASQTFSYTYVGGTDFPLSFGNGPGAQAAGATWTPASRVLTWTSTPSAAYSNLTCTAPLIPMGESRKIGRFSFKRTDGTEGFVAGQSATFTWATTSSCNLYLTSPVCAPTVTGFSTVALRTLATPCALTVPSACAVTGTATTTSPSCFGGTNGTAEVTLSGIGSTGGGSYSVDGLGSTAFASSPFTVTGLAAGTHTIVATMTTGGCVSAPISASIAQAAPFTGSASQSTAPTCVGATDGTTSITLSSFTAASTYTVDGGSAQNYTTNPFTVSGLSTGNHTVVATSSAGCVSSDIPVTIGAAAPFTGSGTGGSVSCFGATDGTASISVSAGTSGSYTVDGGGSLNYLSNPFTVSNLAAGSHTIVATSGAGCTSNNISVTVGNVAQLTGSATAGSISCSGATDGSTTVTLSSFTAASTYTVDGGSPVAYSSNPFTVSGLASGSHTIVATSSAGCVSSDIPVSIASVAALTGSGTTTPTSCSNSADGAAQITLSASTSGTYTVDAGAPQNYTSNPFTVSGLSAGNHTIVATSAAGCTSNLIGVNVASPAALTGSGTTTPTSCGGGPTGTATITLSSSTSGTYKVDGGAAVAYTSNPFTINGLGAGPHTIVATASAGCVSSDIVVNVGGSSAFAPTYVKTNLSACSGTNDGTITVTPTGGSGPYSYVWSGGYPGFAPGNVAAVSNLPIGYYNVTVTDLGGCGSQSFTNIHIEYAYYVYITNSGSQSSACGNTGSVLLYGNAGITPYTYALSAGSAPAGTYQASNSFTGLAAGNYTAYVKDAAGCVSNKQVTVTAAAQIVVNPYTRAASACGNDGSIEIYRTGGIPPYMYSLDGVTYQTGNIYSGLAAGNYTAYVKDSKGCVGQQSTTVAAGAALTVGISKVNTSSCVNDGSIQVNASGGIAPYTYSINGGSYGASNSFSGLGAGSYAISVKDSKGCTGSTNVTITVNAIGVTASVTNATTCTSNNGKIQLFRTGGVGPYTYSLDGNTYQPGTVFTNVPAGTYSAYVKDSKTCIGVLNGIVVGPTGCSGTRTAGSNTKQIQVVTDTKVTAYPNPSVTEFTLILSGYNPKDNVVINVTDLLGRTVYQVTGLAKVHYRLGQSFKAGMYNVEVIQGSKHTSLKLVKE